MSNRRNLQRSGRSGQAPIRTSSRVDPDRHELLSALKFSTTRRPTLPLSLLPTSHVARTPIQAPKKGRERKETAEIQQAYPNSYAEPDPASSDFTSDDQEAPRKTITAFGDEMYEVSTSRNSTAKAFSIAFIPAFCPHSLKTWP